LAKEQSNFAEELREWLSQAKIVVIAGIGNPIRSDDSVGMKIVQELQGKASKKVHLIECETVPESFMDEIVELKPSHVLLIDAAVMGLNRGEVRLFDAEKLTNFPAVSTHMLPLPVFCEYIKQLAKAKLALLVIEPGNMEFGEGLTEEVAHSAKKVVQSLVKALC